MSRTPTPQQVTLSSNVKVTSSAPESRNAGALPGYKSLSLLLPFIPFAVMDLKVVAVLCCLSALTISSGEGNTAYDVCAFVCLCGSKDKTLLSHEPHACI